MVKLLMCLISGMQHKGPDNGVKDPTSIYVLCQIFDAIPTVQYE